MESTDVLKARPDEAVDGGGSLNALRDGEFSTTHKQELGDQLYESITKWYPGQAEMLVGMLLELDHKHLEILIQDEVLLKHRVQEAVRALESYQGGSFEENGVCNVGDKESLGDKIYKVVVDLYPDRAEQITGMLLEMDVEDLLVLVERNDLLSGKAQQAYEALGGVTEQKSTHSSDFGEIGEKLYKLVEDVYPSCADKLTGMLLEMDRQCLQNLMKNPTSLEERMAEAFLVLGNADGNTDAAFEEHEKRLTIGEQLYAIVENFQPENADKVTGMLLEMPANELSVLMDNQSLLEQKVTQSLKALTEDSGLARSNEKEYLGEQLYEIISKDLPEHAERITGMLLEMDLGCIEELLQNPDILDDKVQAALKVVLHEASWGESSMSGPRAFGQQIQSCAQQEYSPKPHHPKSSLALELRWMGLPTIHRSD